MISVIVPTYRRPGELERCLSALAAQSRQADQIIVVVRDDDARTRDFLANWPAKATAIVVAGVSVPGVVAAMNAGLAAARGNLIALTDDDAAPRPDWLARIEAHFDADLCLGGVGGRDWVYHDGVLEQGQARDPGNMTWFGRVSAGHHLAVGPPREVVVLKGVNCAYRADPLRKIGFDSRLAGGGAQVHWELALGLAMKRAGWKLILDPAIAVDHYPAQRFDEDRRHGFSSVAQRNAVANESLILIEHLRGVSRPAYLAWAAFIGTRVAPGLFQLPRLALRRQRNLFRLWWATLGGRLAGLSALRAGRPSITSQPRIPANGLSSSGVHS